jgi:GcrA cell cycle regulator
MIVFVWTDTKVAELKERHARGESMTAMGAAMGCSRSAIVGKIHRLKLGPTTAMPGRQPSSRQIAPKISLAPSDYENATELTALDGSGVTLDDLTQDACRWPLGDPREPSFRYCGQMAIDGKSYCAKHFQISRPVES